MNAPPSLQFSFVVAALLLALIITCDLALRYLAFDRLESIAIDAALFGLVYFTIEFVHALSKVGDSEALAWAAALGGLELVILVLLTVWHRWLNERLRSQVLHSIDVVLAKDGTPLTPARVALKQVVAHAVEVALSDVKPRKRERRRELLDALHSDPGLRSLTEANLQLDPRTRRAANLGFVFLGTVAFALVVVSSHILIQPR
jgi:hypothetical protein